MKPAGRAVSAATRHFDSISPVLSEGVTFRFAQNQPLSGSAVKQKGDFLGPGPRWNDVCN